MRYFYFQTYFDGDRYSIWCYNGFFYRCIETGFVPFEKEPLEPSFEFESPFSTYEWTIVSHSLEEIKAALL